MHIVLRAQRTGFNPNLDQKPQVWLPREDMKVETQRVRQTDKMDKGVPATLHTY